MTIAWVLGSSGVLGRALCRALHCDGTKLFFPTKRFCWNSSPDLFPQIATAVQAFSSQISAADQWEIYWAAGVGNMGSSEDTLAPETRVLSLLIQLLESEPHLMAISGAMAFASSAGAIYAGSSDDIITENTPATPTSAYAHEKLRQEDLIRTFAVNNSRVAALISRISTLYGPGQTAGKKHGLLAHIARSILRNQPIRIYVPYDTMRDYIAADDAAAAMVATLRATNKKQHVLIKIISSEHLVTIAEIISIFKRISRRSPRIITSASELSGLYSHHQRFRSIILPGCVRVPTMSIHLGIARLMAAEHAAFAQCSNARVTKTLLAAHRRTIDEFCHNFS